MKTHTLLLAALLIGLASTQTAAQFIVTILDQPGEGFNDLTPRTSDIDGLPTTLGEDRLNCLSAALQVWANYLDITVPLELEITFDPLGGSPNSAILGFAGPNSAGDNFPGAPLPNMLFTLGQANQHAGFDQANFAEMTASFNSDVDGNIVLGDTVWDYGIDGIVPFDKLDFFSVVLHELGHGLGFLSLMDGETGELFMGVNDIFTNHLHQQGLVNKDYADMTDLERQAANISGEVVWKGDAVVAAQLAPEPIYAPNPYESGSSVSHWDTTASPNLLMEPSYTQPFLALSLEEEAFVDLFWPIAVVVPTMVGDVNGDDAINSTDALWMIQVEFGLRTGVLLESCDLNGDNFCNSTDALWAIQIEFGLREAPTR